MMKKFILILSLILTSCAKDLGTAESEVFQIIENLEEGVTFEQLQKQILAPKCLRCHAWVSDEEEVLKRVVPGEPNSSSLYLLVENGSMPVGGPELSALEKDFVATYISGLGKTVPDNPDDPVDPDDQDPTPPVQLVTFEEVKTTILVPHCIACHRGFEQESGLDRYIDKDQPFNSTLLSSVESGFMPLRAPDLSEAKVQLLRDYLDSLSP